MCKASTPKIFEAHAHRHALSDRPRIVSRKVIETLIVHEVGILAVHRLGCSVFKQASHTTICSDSKTLTPFSKVYHLLMKAEHAMLARIPC